MESKAFERVWKIAKPLCSIVYSRNMHVIKYEKLGKYLMEGYEEYLPTEFAPCGRPTIELVEEYVDSRRKAEREDEENIAPATTEDEENGKWN